MSSRILILELCFHRWAHRVWLCKLVVVHAEFRPHHRHVWVNKWQGLQFLWVPDADAQMRGGVNESLEWTSPLHVAYKYVYWVPWITHPSVGCIFSFLKGMVWLIQRCWQAAPWGQKPKLCHLTLCFKGQTLLKFEKITAMRLISE